MAASDSAHTPYRVLARKYRPENFDDLIGQEPMVTTLTNAFRTGRIAQAYMLTGVRGVGKTTTARILARALNYKTAEIDSPQIDLKQEGEHCRAIIEGRHVDVIEMDAASHTGIDDIRDIIESTQYAPATARYKVYIIDEVHMLSRSAFNGLLKTLEEPPAHLKFIFATTEIRKVPVTVLSRCQRFDLRRIDAGVLVDYLAKIAKAEEVEAGDEALALIARAAEGSARDALSIFDQAIAHGAGKVEAQDVRAMLGLAERARIVELFAHVMKGDIAAALDELKSQYDSGADPAVVMTDLADFTHFVTRRKYVAEAADDAVLTEVERIKGAEFADSLSVKALGRAWQILVKGVAEIQESEHPLPAADMVLVRLTHAATLPTPDDALKLLGDGVQPSSGTAQGAPRPSGQPTAPVSASQPAGTSTPNAPSGGANRAGSPATMRRPETESGPEPRPAITLETFEELILLAEDRRDIKLRTLLRKNVRLVRFANGKLEINIAGNPPPDFVSDLSRKLAEWTGRRWAVAVSKDGGAPTLEEQEAQETENRTMEARDDPAVAAILKQFPGAKIVNVTVRERGNDVLPDPASETGEAGGDGLDD